MCYAIIRVKFAGNEPKQTIDVESADDLYGAIARVRELPTAVGFRVYRIDEVQERVSVWQEVTNEAG